MLTDDHLCEHCTCLPPICDCCRREVDWVRGSMWHGTARICRECFYMWYDPDMPGVDQTSATSIGNAVRSKHGLAPLPATQEDTPC